MKSSRSIYGWCCIFRKNWRSFVVVIACLLVVVVVVVVIVIIVCLFALVACLLANKNKREWVFFSGYRYCLRIVTGRSLTLIFI